MRGCLEEINDYKYLTKESKFTSCLKITGLLLMNTYSTINLYYSIPK